MKNEEVIEIDSYRPNQAPYYAFIFSLIWNLCVLFLLFFVFHQKHTKNVTLSAEPLVVFQNPLMPTPLTQNNPPQQMPIQQLQPLQQTALQQPPDFSNPSHDELNYLVQQLISYGNSNWGAVVSAVDDVPGGQVMAQAEPQPTAIEQQTEAATEDNVQVAQESAENNGETAEEASEADAQQAHDEKPTLSDQDKEILQETAQSIAATLSEKTTAYLQHASAEPRTVRRSSPGRTQPIGRVSGNPHQPSKSRSLTLADITHSFMKQVRDEKQIKYHYDPQQKGAGAGMPGVYSPAKNGCTGKELALQMYATKVFMMMQQSAHALSSLIYANTDFTEQSLLEITINYDGKLLRATLNPPIHEKDVELAVQKIVERVGLFPPLPKHFNTDSITLTFPLNIQGTKGFGRYSLSYSANDRP